MTLPELEYAQKALEESYRRGFADCRRKVQEEFYLIAKDDMDGWAANMGDVVRQLMEFILPEMEKLEEEMGEDATEEIQPPPPPPLKSLRKSAADPREAAAAVRQGLQTSSKKKKPKQLVASTNNAPSPKTSPLTAAQQAALDEQYEKLARKSTGKVNW